MTDIPDDVVEKAVKAFTKIYQDCGPFYIHNATHAAGRVFVEWALKQPTGCVGSDTATNGGNAFISRSTDRER